MLSFPKKIHLIAHPRSQFRFHPKPATSERFEDAFGRRHGLDDEQLRRGGNVRDKDILFFHAPHVDFAFAIDIADNLTRLKHLPTVLGKEALHVSWRFWQRCLGWRDKRADDEDDK